MPEKTLHNSDVSGARKNVSDLSIVGNGDSFQSGSSPNPYPTSKDPSNTTIEPTDDGLKL